MPVTTTQEEHIQVNCDVCGDICNEEHAHMGEYSIVKWDGMYPSDFDTGGNPIVKYICDKCAQKLRQENPTFFALFFPKN